jgi:hypothetical protein
VALAHGGSVQIRSAGPIRAVTFSLLLPAIRSPA